MSQEKRTPGLEPSKGKYESQRQFEKRVRDSQVFMQRLQSYSAKKQINREQLIAAAPELLEALIAIKEVLDFAIGADLVPPSADGPAVMAAAAIAKATGEHA